MNIRSTTEKKTHISSCSKINKEFYIVNNIIVNAIAHPANPNQAHLINSVSSSLRNIYASATAIGPRSNPFNSQEIFCNVPTSP
jgi:hypothetical protein